MKNLILISFLILFATTTFAQDQKFTAAIMDLQAEEGVSQSVARTLSDYLRGQLFNTQKFSLVTRENMEQILREQAFQVSVCTDKECIVEVGKLLGVRKMFAGSIGKMGTTYIITLKIIDVESGKIERVETEECAECKEESLLVSVKNLANKIVGLPVMVAEKLQKTEGPSTGVGFGTSGLYLKLFSSSPVSLEGRFYFFESGITTIGPRVYINFNPNDPFIFSIGAEYEYIIFNLTGISGNGSLLYGFAGIDWRISRNLGLSLDCGPTYTYIKESSGLDCGGVDFLYNFGVYTYF